MEATHIICPTPGSVKLGTLNEDDDDEKDHIKNWPLCQ